MKSITKFFLVVGILMTVFLFFQTCHTYSVTGGYAKEMLKERVNMASKLTFAARRYAAGQIRPVMHELPGKEICLPEAMSASFASQLMFDEIHKDFPDHIIRFSSDNPRNPDNLAGPEELRIIEHFNNNPRLGNWTGEIRISGNAYMAKFIPSRMQESCLHCHGDPADAPAALLKQYGPDAGFHRSPDEVIALSMIAIPMHKVMGRLWPDLIKNFLGTGLWLLLVLAVFVKANKKIMQEMRERRQTEEKLRKAADAAEAANLAKNEFLASMSHEFRTPMNGIIGMCDLFLTDKDGSDRRKKERRQIDRKRAEYMKIVHTSAKSLLGLINDILDFSKIEAGRLDFENVPFLLREVIEDVSDLFLETIAEKKVEMIVDIAPGVPCQVIADPLRLRQVLMNLLSNAFKFTNKGEICLQCSVNSNSLSVSNTPDMSDNRLELLFCVRDTGIGIAAESHEELFDAFTQTDTRKYGGTGLGLAICKRIVNMMGGNIWVESEPGAGSSFYFTASFKSVPDKDGDWESFVPNDLKNLSLLVVEDNPTALRVIGRFLEFFGFHADAARSAEEVLTLHKESLDRGRYDLILMDTGLPDMDGITASEKIKKDMGMNAPPIIINTLFGEEKETRRASELGIDTCLLKPLKPFLLFKSIMEIFGYKDVAVMGTSSNSVCTEEISNAHVLIVEDHPVNRRVATEILEAVGISADTADSGLEAIEAIQRKKYDAVLMDVQMPGMNGLEATKAIRNLKLDTRNLMLDTRNLMLDTRNLMLDTQNLMLDTRYSKLDTQNPSIKHQASSKQASSIKYQIPIIAMTAHAMSGDREKCLKAGMDDYISKPISRRELLSVLKKNISRMPNAEYGMVNKENLNFESSALPGLNIEDALERFGGSWNLYMDVLKDFLEHQKGLVSDFRDIIEKKDFEEAMLKAHSLKGAAGNVSAADLGTAAKALEDACENKNRDIMPDILGALENAFVQVRHSFEKMSDLHRPEDHVTEPVKKEESRHDLSAHPELFRKLDKALQKSDPVESEYWLKEIRAHAASDSLKAKLSDLERQIGNYNFDDARKILNRFA
ncbi:response regulator [Desulfobacterales bacterium HSG2]|nr:response regulator [Desulfobacterales bacterium HSG2]